MSPITTMFPRSLFPTKVHPPMQIIPKHLVLPICLSPDPRHLLPIIMGDMAGAVCRADEFEKILKLPDPVHGCPSFRKVRGIPIYCCEQPTIAGLEAALNRVCGDKYPKNEPRIWTNLHQEPDVSVNEKPICAHPPFKIGKCGELGNIVRDIVKTNTVELVKQCNMGKTDDGVDINMKPSEIVVKERKSLSQVIGGLKEKFRGLVSWKFPNGYSVSPFESVLDMMVKTLVGPAVNTPVIVNDQVGLSRAATGCVVTCLFKKFQISASFESLIETVPGIKESLLKLDRKVMDFEEQKQNLEEDTPFREKFEVVQQLLTNRKNGVGSKNNAEEIMDCAAQAFLVTKIMDKTMDKIQTSLYVIIFAGYVSDHAVCARYAMESQQYLQRPKVTKRSAFKK